jgi:hypothetical protein
LKINEAEGTIYIKYPYESEYLLSLSHMFKDKSRQKKQNVNKESMRTYIPKDKCDTIVYKNGYECNLWNEEKKKMQSIPPGSFSEIKHYRGRHHQVTLKVPAGEKIKTVSYYLSSRIYYELMKREGVPESKICPC